MKLKLTLGKCPTCGADIDQPCRTPKGRKKKNVHDTRPFSLDGVFRPYKGE